MSGMAPSNNNSKEATFTALTACEICGVRDHMFKDRCFRCGLLFHEDTCGKEVSIQNILLPLHLGGGSSSGVACYCNPCGQAIQPESFPPKDADRA
jgi:hypothetical protein